MTQLRVVGGNRLEGSLWVQGAKNAALPILAACLLSRETVILRRCPKLSDVNNMLGLLHSLGCRSDWDEDVLVVDPSLANCCEMPEGLSRELRSSIFMLGPILARFKRAVVTYPGGCEIGLRPIDLHLKGLRAMGAKIREEGGMIVCEGEQMRGANVHLDFPSVGATENLMLAAVLTPGVTTISGAAREPEIVDLQNFVNRLGAKVSGAGTDAIRIEGVKMLSGGEYTIMSDRIVTGTFMVAAAMTGGDIRLRGTAIEHVRSVSTLLSQAGCRIDEDEEGIRISAKRRMVAVGQVQTRPYPGFPTDMQAQWMALAAISAGRTEMIENIFEDRFKHAAELARMGADIHTDGQHALINGVKQLHGAEVTAMDLRAGAALVLAGLVAQGETNVLRADRIDRGYEQLEITLGMLGADITRV